MPRKRFTNEQIAFALRQAENGATVDEVCRKMGVSEPTFYRGKKQFVDMGVQHVVTKDVAEIGHQFFQARRFQQGERLLVDLQHAQAA